VLQFGDSMLPIGGFSFSGGLESAIQKGVVTDVASLGEFTRTAVEQAARGDGIAIVCAHRAALAGRSGTARTTRAMRGSLGRDTGHVDGWVEIRGAGGACHPFGAMRTGASES
jgi:urease accessory protein UreF